MDLQKINFKVFIDAPSPVPLEPFLDIFSRWREDKSDPSQWIDLADYGHVERGPGIMLIGHQGNLATDLAAPGPGLLYSNKQGLSGTLEDRLRESWRRALTLTARLIADPGYPQQLRPRPGSWEVSFNDRLEASNTDETDQKLQPVVHAIARQVFGTDEFTLVRQPDPGRRCGYTLHTEHLASLDTISESLETATS